MVVNLLASLSGISKVPVLQVSSAAAQRAVTYSKSTMGTLEKGVKYIQC